MSFENELLPSELGTKEYWDETYSTEIQNFRDFGDVGEVWFGNGCATRIIQWMNSSGLVQKNESVLDLGCGNGMLLIKLAKEGWKNLTGVDYSANAIDLATSIANSEGYSITYKVWDILSESDIPGSSQFCLALDKGTFDAISLSPGDRGKSREKYITNVKRIIKPGGNLLLTSCNWTEEELKTCFTSAGAKGQSLTEGAMIGRMQDPPVKQMTTASRSILYPVNERQCRCSGQLEDLRLKRMQMLLPYAWKYGQPWLYKEIGQLGTIYFEGNVGIC